MKRMLWILAVLTFTIFEVSSAHAERGFRRGYQGGSQHYYQQGSYNGNRSDYGQSRSNAYQGSNGVVTGQHSYGAGSTYDAYRGNQKIGGGSFNFAGGESNTGSSYGAEYQRSAINESKAKTLREISANLASMSQMYTFYEDAYRRGQIPSNEKYYMDNIFGWAKKMQYSAAAGAQARTGSEQDRYARQTREELLQFIAWVKLLDQNIGLSPQVRAEFRNKVEIYEPSLR